MEDRTDVQNIDMMNLAGFCRNCLSRWYQEAANEKGIEMGKDEARQIFYGMTMDVWKAQYQTEASPEKQAAFKVAFDENVTKKGLNPRLHLLHMILFGQRPNPGPATAAILGHTPFPT